jgi:NADH dehydrogenase FAD-containing subunit
MTNHRVTGIDAESVDLGGKRLPARTVIWAAGVAASPLARSLGVPLDRAGRVLVEPDLTIPGFLAWLAWLFIPIFFLIGFRNRALVLFDWAYSFLTFRRGARLITGVEHPEEVLRPHPAPPPDDAKRTPAAPS